MMRMPLVSQVMNRSTEGTFGLVVRRETLHFKAITLFHHQQQRQLSGLCHLLSDQQHCRVVLHLDRNSYSTAQCCMIFASFIRRAEPLYKVFLAERPLTSITRTEGKNCLYFWCFEVLQPDPSRHTFDGHYKFPQDSTGSRELVLC